MSNRISSGLPSFARHFRTAGGLIAALAVLVPYAFAAPPEAVERAIGPGARLLTWTDPSGPNRLTAVEADLTDPFLRAGLSVGRGDRLALEPLSRQADRVSTRDRYAIAAVNGDFFYYPDMRQPGIPTNALVRDGELIRTPFSRSCLVLEAGGAPSIRLFTTRGRITLPDGTERPLDAVNQPRGSNRTVLFTPWYGPGTRAGAEGTEVYLEPESFPLRPGVTHRAKVVAVQTGVGDAAINQGRWVLSGSGPSGAALRGLAPGVELEIRVDLEPPAAPGDAVLGGGPRLVRGGRISVETEGGSLGDAFARARHPRTAIGFAGRKLYMVVVDGRQPGDSVGMSLPELARVMLDLGCTDALNMDGGGSTTLWVRGAVMNRPSDGRERPVANGLILFSTAPKGEAVRLAPSPPSIDALAGAAVPLAPGAEDRYYNPAPLPQAVAWSVPPELGEVRDAIFRAGVDVRAGPGQDYASGTIVTQAGGVLRAEIPLRVFSRPARVDVLPAVARVAPGKRARFRVRAYAGDGRELLLPESVVWSASPGIGTVEAGELLAGLTPGRGTVSAVVNGVAGGAQVVVE